MMYSVKGESLTNDPRHIASWRIWANSPNEARRKVFNKIRGKVDYYVVREAEEAIGYHYGDQDF